MTLQPKITYFYSEIMLFRIAKITSLCLAILWLMAMPMASRAQTNYNYTIYTREDGLASGTITGISKDSTGFLWLFSENGLTRFDGYDFKIFQNNPNDPRSISSPYISELIMDGKKNMVFRAYNSFSKYNAANGTFKKLISYYSNEYFINCCAGKDFIWVLVKGSLVKLDASNEKTIYYKLPADFLSRTSLSIAECNGTVFIAGRKNILQFNIISQTFSNTLINYGDSVSNHLNDYPLRLFKDSKKNIGFFNGDGPFIFDTTKHQFQKITNASNNTNTRSAFTSQIVLENKYSFASTGNGKLHQLNIETGAEKIIDLQQDYNVNTNSYIKAIYNGRNTKLWLATTGPEFYCYYPKTGKLESFVTGNGKNITGNNYYIFEDNNNIVWVSMAGTGLVKAELTKQIFPSFKPTNNLPLNASDNVRGISELTKDSLLINTINGILLLNKSTHQFSAIDYSGNSFSGSTYSKILVDKDSNLWIAGWQRQGLFYVNTKTKKVTRFTPLLDKQNKATASVRCMLIDSRGYLWLGTSDNSILRVKISSINFNKPENTVFEIFNSTTLTNDQLLFNIVFTIIENDKAQIYFGTQSGVYIYSYSTQKISILKTDEAINLLSDVRAFCFDNHNTLWMGTNGIGLLAFNQQTKQLRSYTTKNGLPDNSVYTILNDAKNNLWLGTNKGLCRFNPDQNIVRNFSLKDGIQNYEYNTNAACKLSTGELAFGGINGLNIFNPDSVQTLSDVPEIVITQFQVQESNKPIVNETVNLNYNENYISFRFAALNYLRNEENQYAYKLEGLDKDWIYCDKRRFTNYANLSPGQYTFRVKCSNANGVWNDTGASMSLLIATPWYGTWWFRVLIFFTIVAGIYAWYRYRLYQTLKLQAVRDRIGRDLHDEIGSTLQSIAFYSEVASKVVTEKAPEAQSMLTQISESTTNMMEAMSDIVWAINTRNDSFANIINRMRAFAVEVLEAKNCSVHFDISEILMHYNLDMEKRKNLYLIFKETINNSAKHAACKNVWVDFHSKGNHLNLKIRDDGKGFKIENDFSGNGLFNIRKRASELNGDIKITSEPGKGTTIQLSFVP